MAGIEYRLSFGTPSGLRGLDAKLSAYVSKAVAEEALRKVRRRVNHPATTALKATGTNQWSARISGPRGGPGPIYPVRAQALRFVPKGGSVVFARRVNGAGLGPLIESETRKVQEVALGNITL